MKTEYKRKCPACKKELSYKHKHSYKNAVKNNKFCRSCTTKKQYEKEPDKNKGLKNGRTGKKFKDVLVDKYGKKLGKEKYEEWLSQLSEHGFKSGK